MSLLCFFAHHRSASSWANDILRTIAVAAGWRHQVVHNAAMFDHDLPAFIRRTKPDLLTFSNAQSCYLQDLPPFKGFHLIRDPRDVLVSAYFSHRNSHPTDQWPELVRHRAELRACSEAEGFMLELTCRGEQFEDMYNWPYNLPHICEMKMEEMVQSPTASFQGLFLFWDRLQESVNEKAERRRVALNRRLWWLERRLKQRLNLPRWSVEKVWPWLIEEVVADHTFRQKSGGRMLGQTNASHHYRNGVAGDWQRHFSPALTRQFKREYNALLLKLGYEASEEW